MEIHGSPRTKNEIINKIISRNNYHCKRCLFVGDAMTDYNASIETGLNLIGIVKDNEILPFPKAIVERILYGISEKNFKVESVKVMINTSKIVCKLCKKLPYVYILNCKHKIKSFFL